MQENIVLYGGEQYVQEQIIYLDFDGTLTVFNGEILRIDQVEVSNSDITDERSKAIVEQLNNLFAGKSIRFVATMPSDGEYSTIYVGKSNAFDSYGKFSGLAETVDKGNINKSDKAFVLLDAQSSDAEIIEVIAHEAEHLLGTLDHGGDGLERYAHKPVTFTGNIGKNKSLQLDGRHNCQECEKGEYYRWAENVVITDGGRMLMNKDTSARKVAVGSGTVIVKSGAIISEVELHAGGELRLEAGAGYNGVLDARGGGVKTAIALTICDNALFQSWENDGDADGIENYDNGHVAVGKNATFINCTSGYTGGAIFNGKKATMTVGDGARFLNNEAERGGAIYNEGKMTLGDNAVWSGNSTWYIVGGLAIANLNGGNIKIGNNALFKENIAGEQDGTILNGNNARIEIGNDGKFIANKTETGGAILNSNGIVIIGENARFENNTALCTGGAINNGSYGTMEIGDGAVFVNNISNEGYRGDRGGAIYNDATLKLGKNVVFDGNITIVNDNSFEEDGGAIYNVGTLSIDDNVLFTGNKACNGGAIYNADGGQITLNGMATFNGNVASFVPSGHFLELKGAGGAIVNTGRNSTITLNDAKFLTASDTIYNDAVLVVNGTINTVAGIVMGNNGSLVNNGTIEFKLSSTGTGTGILLNSWEKVSGNGEFVISVDADQATGDYVIIDDADYFAGNFTLRCGNTELGTLTVDGKTLYSNDTLAYKLVEQNDKIVMTVRKVTGPIVPEYDNVKVYQGDKLAFMDEKVTGVALSSNGYTSMYVSNGGVATGTTLEKGGHMYLRDGGKAIASEINYNGHVFVGAGCVAEDSIINLGGDLQIGPGGLGLNTVVNKSGNGRVYNGGLLKNTTMEDGGRFSVDSGGVAQASVLKGSAALQVLYSGSAVDTTLNGESLLRVYYGSATNVKIRDNSCVELEGESVLDGFIEVASTASIKVADKEATINFSLAGCNGSEGYRLSDYSRITGEMPNFTITIEPKQHSGIYKLAKNASAFSGSISIGDGTKVYGALTAGGGALEIDNAFYSLNNDKGNLTLRVQSELELQETADNWSDLAVNGANGQVGSVGVIDNSQSEITAGWVGDVDAVDYMSFEVTENCKLFFSIQATDASKFAIYQLCENKNGKFSLKNLQTTALKKDKNTGNYYVDTAGLLLTSGTYYMGMHCTGKQVGCSVDYTVSTNHDKNIFYSDGDNSDDWTDMKTAGAAGLPGEPDSLRDWAMFVNNNWVGYGDAVDYKAFTLEDAAKLSFKIKSSDAVKVTIYQLNSKTDKNGVTTYSLKALQSTNVKANQTISSKALLLDSGTYYACITSTNAAKGGSATYSMTPGKDTYFYTDGNNSDDWTDMKTAGAAGLPGEPDTIHDWSMFVNDDWVGYGDAVDYKAFTIDNARLSFDIKSSDAVKVTIYQLNSKTDKNGVTTYSLKALQSTNVKANQTITSKALLLERGTYYACITSTNAAKGGNAEYSIAIGDDAYFYGSGDNSDDWTDMKTAGAASLNDPGVLGLPSTFIVHDGWVGFGDAVDYSGFILNSGAKLSFDITSSDAARFTVYQLNSKTDKKGVTTYSLKALQNTTIKAGQTVTTKDLLLANGTYYIGMTSTNAAKGGNARYSIEANSNCEFYDQGDNTDDWTDIKTDGAENLEFSLGTLNNNVRQLIADGWVGLGDAVDYSEFTLQGSAKLNFDLNSTNAIKFTVYELVGKTDKNGVTTYSLKSLQSTSVAANKDVTTKDLWLTAGTYYVGIANSNANKNINADYTLELSGKSYFCSAGDNNNSDDTWKLASDRNAAESGESISGWVGFGDTVDYLRLVTDESGFLSVGLDEITAESIKDKSLKISCLDSKGKAVALKGMTDGEITSQKVLAAGEYYLGLTCTNPKKQDVDYSVTLSVTA